MRAELQRAGLPDTGLPDFPAPRTPVPPPPVAVEVLAGYFERYWATLSTPGRTQFLALLADRDLPLVEPDPDGGSGHRAVTFLYRDGDQYRVGDQAAPASAVILSANSLVHQDSLAACEFTRVSGTGPASDAGVPNAVPNTGLWALTYRMPSDWEASYRITVHTGNGPAPWRLTTDRRAVRLAADDGGPDPLNRSLGAGMNGSAQSVLRLPDAPAAPWLGPATPLPGAGTGVMGGADFRSAPQAAGLETWTVFDSGAQRSRTVWIYRPPEAGPETGPATPLVLLHDGQVWARYLNLKATLDAAVRAGVVPPVHVAMIDSGDVTLRGQELSGPTGTVDFVARDLLPLLRAGLPVTAEARETVASGASYGGLASLWQLARYPELVGTALAQSPSLWRYDLAGALAAVACDPGPGSDRERVRIRLQAGIFETSIHEPSTALFEALGPQGADIRLNSITGGHDWAWWNPWLIRGLAELLG